MIQGRELREGGGREGERSTLPAVALRPLKARAPAGAIGLAVGLSLIALPPAAAAQTVATIAPSFAPDLPGARTSVTFAASFAGARARCPHRCARR